MTASNHRGNDAHGDGGGPFRANLLPLIQTGEPTLPGCPAVWLATDASLMRSHQQETEGEPLVVHVVGVADHGDWAGAVLMLG